MSEFVIRQVANKEEPEEVPDNDGKNEANVINDDSDEENIMQSDNNEEDSDTNSSSNTEPEPEKNDIAEKCTSETTENVKTA